MKSLYGQNLVNEIKRRAVESRKRIFISSPYIGDVKAIDMILGNKWRKDSVNVRILADFSDVRNINKDTLNFIIQNIFSKIKSLKQLHAKIYIFDNLAIVSSANLTRTSFKKRHEVGVLLSKEESKDFIKLFNVFWNQADKPSKKRLIAENKKRKNPVGRGDNFSSKVLTNLWEFAETGDEGEGYPPNYWIKVIGRPNARRKYDYNLGEEINKGYTTFGKKPKGLKKNDIVFLGTLSKSKDGKNDVTIYGKAKVKKSFRENIDDVYKHINKRSQFSEYGIENNIDEDLKRWRYGLWMKDIIILKGLLKNGLWNSKFKKGNGQTYVSKYSFRNGYKQISKEIADRMDKELTKKFKKFGNYPQSSPNSFWFNELITPSANKKLMKLVK